MMTQISKRTRRPRPDGGATLAAALDPAFFKALADPRRLAILARLAACGRACTVTEVAACCPTDFSVVSRHLRQLAAAGIIAAERRGKQVYYAVRFSSFTAVLRTLAAAIDGCCPPVRGRRVAPTMSRRHPRTSRRPRQTRKEPRP